jgi:hypothetical protein
MLGIRAIVKAAHHQLSESRKFKSTPGFERSTPQTFATAQALFRGMKPGEWRMKLGRERLSNNRSLPGFVFVAVSSPAP